MLLAKVLSRNVQGPPTLLTTIEAHISHGLPGFDIIGLSSSVARGARTRIRSAIINSGYVFPVKRITVNVTPHNIGQYSTYCDLPIAIAILLASEQIKIALQYTIEYLGELSLDGGLQGVQGIVSAINRALTDQHHIIVPNDNIRFAELFINSAVTYASNLRQVCLFIENKQGIKKPTIIPSLPKHDLRDIQDIVGQYHARRALEISAAGAHNLLIFGTPGSGKTLLATRLPTLFPSLTVAEQRTIAEIYNLSTSTSFPFVRPFRAPHHGIKLNSLLGCRKSANYGEITLAHGGILFLDDITKFEKKILDALTLSIESEYPFPDIAAEKPQYSATFQLIATMTLPVAYRNWMTQGEYCNIRKYLALLIHPLFNRFQLSVTLADLSKTPSKSSVQSVDNSQEVRQRVIAARQKQCMRQGKTNALLNYQETHQHCALTSADYLWFKKSCLKLCLSEQNQLNTLRVARTIADLQNKDKVTLTILKEALSYRSIERLVSFLNQRYK